jgi:hypothetical protein
MASEIWAALLGAAVAGGIAVVTQWVSGRQNRSATLDDERARRLGEFLAATHAAVLAIGELAYLPMGETGSSKAPFLSGPEMQALRDRVNSVLNTIQLLDDEGVVQAVAELDRCLVRLQDEALGNQWNREAWRVRRTKVLGNTVDDVYSAGRAALRRAPIDRPKLWSSADQKVLVRVRESPAGTQRPPYGTGS